MIFKKILLGITLIYCQQLVSCCIPYEEYLQVVANVVGAQKELFPHGSVILETKEHSMHLPALCEINQLPESRNQRSRVLQPPAQQ